MEIYKIKKHCKFVEAISTTNQKYGQMGKFHSIKILVTWERNLIYTNIGKICFGFLDRFEPNVAIEG